MSGAIKIVPGGTINSASRGYSRDVWDSQVHATSQPLLVRTNAWTQRALNLNYVYAESQISQFDWASCQVNTKLFSDSSKPLRVLLWLVVRSSHSMGGSWASLDLNKLAIKTKSITKLPFILCHRGQIVDHLKQGIQLFTLWGVFLVYWLRSVMPILLVGGPLQNHHQDERIWDPASDSRHRFYTGILENDKRLEMFTRWQ